MIQQERGSRGHKNTLHLNSISYLGPSLHRARPGTTQCLNALFFLCAHCEVVNVATFDPNQGGRTTRKQAKQTGQGGVTTQTHLEMRRCGVGGGRWVLSLGDRSNHARAQTTVAPSGRTRSRLCQRSLNSGISWTQHWRFGLCLHKRDRKHCKLFTGEHGVTVCLCVCHLQLCVRVCACVYKAMLWLLWNGLTRLWLRQHQHRDSGMCPYTNTQATHTGHVFNNTHAQTHTDTHAHTQDGSGSDVILIFFPPNSFLSLI